jgi:hypothetical protein
MSYTPEILAVACPACNAAPTARCYFPVRDGSQHRADPHPERIRTAAFMPRPHNVGGCECPDNSQPCTSTGRREGVKP